MDNYTRKKGIVYKNQFHTIFCPKYKRPVLVDGVDTRLKEIIQDIISDFQGELKALEVMPDHVHVFIDIDPRIPIHEVVKKLKGTSSRILREEFPMLKSRLPSLWTRNYFSCTVGHINEETVKHYIESQKRSGREDYS